MSRWIWAGLGLLPSPVLRCLFTCMSKLHYALDKRHVRECERMVKWSGVSGDERRMIKGMYSHLWQLLPDLIQASKRPWESFRQNISGLEEFEAYIQKHHEGKGLVFISGHIGNWELCGWVLSRSVSPMLSIYKPHKSKLVNDFMALVREQSGQKIIEKEGAMMAIYKTVRRGGIAGLLVDQHGGVDGVDSTFLGRPCKSWDSAVQLSHRSKCPMMFVSLTRTKKGYHFSWSESMQPIPKKDGGLDVQKSVRAMDEALSDLVRKNPEQWLWLGRRWGRDFDREVECAHVETH